jgi:O-antigen/teichoic acid export membrane protein
VSTVGREGTESPELPEVEGLTTPSDTARFVDMTGEGRRGRVARGTLINSVFLLGLNLLALIRGFAVAGFIEVDDYGVWGLVVVGFTTLYGLALIGVSDKYIQQDSDDQELAFQRAFTLQLMVSGAFVVLMWVAMPLYALAYGTWEVLLPGWVLTLAMPASAFQAPLWTFYRRLDYLKQRRLQVWDPVVAMVVTLGLAIVGFGYWAFVIGTIAGAWAAAAVAMRASPYKLAFRYEQGTMLEYRSFSGPLMFEGLCQAVTAMTPTLVAQRSLGTAAVGAMAIAHNISRYAYKADQVVNSTIYPVICAVKDRLELLEEAFLKSNRVGLLWAAPSGLAVAFFAPDLVHFVLGSRWEDAIPVIQVFALIAAVNQIGFNWVSIFRARGDTRPIAVAGLTMAVSVSTIAVPALFVWGLEGYSIGMLLAIFCLVAVRLVYLRRLFSLRAIGHNVAKGVAPALGALAGAGAIRLALWGGERTELQAVLEVAVFGALAVGLTVISERALLHEFRGYLSRGRTAATRPSEAV